MSENTGWKKPRMKKGPGTASRAKRKRCAYCGKFFAPANNRQRYCPPPAKCKANKDVIARRETRAKRDPNWVLNAVLRPEWKGLDYMGYMDYLNDSVILKAKDRLRRGYPADYHVDGQKVSVTYLIEDIGHYDRYIQLALAA